MAGPTGRRPRQSEYGKRLSAKQAARGEYGLRERQFRKYFDLARKVPAATGEKFLELLERRLDNVVYRLDFTQTRRQARQWVNHGHVLVNGKKMTIPSYQVSVGDKVELRSPDMLATRGSELPSWLRSSGSATGEVVAFPKRDEISADIDDQLIVEFYSK